MTVTVRSRRDAFEGVGLVRVGSICRGDPSRVRRGRRSFLRRERRELFEVVAHHVRETRVEIVETFRISVREQPHDAPRIRSKVVQPARAEVASGSALLAAHALVLSAESVRLSPPGGRAATSERAAT